MSVPEIARQLAAVGVPTFPCKDNKDPATRSGFKDATMHPDGHTWPSPIVGVPVPPDVIVIDIDAYKGMSTLSVEQIIGAQDWERGFLQRTPNGGMHYAFYVPTNDLRQGTNLFADKIGKGFDTRAHGRGYICTGEGYTADVTRLLALSQPATQLPHLSGQGFAALTPMTHTDVPAPPPSATATNDDITELLSHIDADCGRDEWLQVALGLKHQFQADDATGYALFDAWSRTGTQKYDAQQAQKLWRTIDPTPKQAGIAPVTIATVAKMAMDRGYQPTGIAATAFATADQSPDVAPSEVIDRVMTKILQEGGKPQAVEELTTAIKGLPCSDLQREILGAALARTLNDHGLKIPIKQIRDAIRPDKAAAAQPRPVPPIQQFDDLHVAPLPSLGTIHGENATQLRSAVFGNRLARFNEGAHWWTGQQWEHVNKTELTAKVVNAFGVSEYAKWSNMESTAKTIVPQLERRGAISPPSRLVFFENGVVDPLHPDLIYPHQPDNNNGTALTVSYDPTQPVVEWMTFLQSIFASEPARILLLQEIMGWCLISDHLNIQKAIALDGVSRSGQGTIIEVLAAIMGRALHDVTIDQLAEPKTLGMLRRVNLAVDRDAKTPRARDAAVVQGNFNKITANEPLSIPIIYEPEPWFGHLNCKYLIACNGLPLMIDDSGAAPGRWVILKFTNSFVGREDLTLGARLKEEATGIAAWALEGLRRLMTTGQFTQPQSSILEQNELLEQSSPALQFANERLVMDPDGKITYDALWNAYKMWAADSNSRLQSKTLVMKSLKQVIIRMNGNAVIGEMVRSGNHSGRGIKGIKLASRDNIHPFAAAGSPLKENVT